LLILALSSSVVPKLLTTLQIRQQIPQQTNTA